MSLRLFAGLALGLLAVAPPLNYSADGGAMLDVAQSFVSDGDLDVECSQATLRREDGRCFSTFYLLQSVALVPFVVLGRLVGTIAGTSEIYASAAVAMALPALVTAGAGTLVAALARERGAGPCAAVMAALAFVIGTEVLTISRTLFAEPLGAACLALCAWGLLAGPDASGRRSAAGCAAAALVVMTKPQLLLAAPAAGAALSLLDRRWRPAVMATVGTGVGSLAVLAYNWHRFGAPLDFGGSGRKLYAGGTAGGPSPPVELLDGAAQLLVSPNHGLLVFGPAALLGLAALLRRPLDRVAAVCLGGVLGVFAFAMIAPDGNFWGTRYLVPMLPLACVGVAALGPRAARVAMVMMLLVAISQAPNMIAYPDRIAREARAEYPEAWEVDRLTIFDVWPAAVRQVRAARDTDPASLVEGADPRDRDDRLLRVVAQWWWMLPAVGIPAILGAGLAVVMLACALVIVTRCARGMPDRGPPAV